MFHGGCSLWGCAALQAGHGWSAGVAALQAKPVMVEAQAMQHSSPQAEHSALNNEFLLELTSNSLAPSSSVDNALAPGYTPVHDVQQG